MVLDSLHAGWWKLDTKTAKVLYYLWNGTVTGIVENSATWQKVNRSWVGPTCFTSQTTGVSGALLANGGTEDTNIERAKCAKTISKKTVIKNHKLLFFSTFNLQLRRSKFGVSVDALTNTDRNLKLANS